MILDQLKTKVIGQEQALQQIVPHINRFEVGLSPSNRPAGVFLMMGPTGTGKTRTVEAVAEVLHGSRHHLLRVDCGEYQMEHEVAKLTGAPPGYLGHRETNPVLTQSRLASITSENSCLSIILFDEIEKAAPSMTRLLLGVLDKATLRLGDNNLVNFERSLIFFTSNLGGAQMSKDQRGGYGLTGASQGAGVATKSAAQKYFSPEWLNRVDEVLTYESFTRDQLRQIVHLTLAECNTHIADRLGPRAFKVSLAGVAVEDVIDAADSARYGAREIKRVFERSIMHRVVELMLARTVTGQRIHFYRLGQEPFVSKRGRVAPCPIG
jgi:ATP-dependent Clp protease ATP-binding subunit ClpA